MAENDELVNADGQTLGEKRAENAAAAEAERQGRIRADLLEHMNEIARSAPLSQSPGHRVLLFVQVLDAVLNRGVPALAGQIATACSVLSSGAGDRYDRESWTWRSIGGQYVNPPITGSDLKGAVRVFGSVAIAEELDRALTRIAGRHQSLNLVAPLVEACEPALTPEIVAAVNAAHPAPSVSPSV